MLCTYQAPKLSFCRLSLDRSLSPLQRSRVQPRICSVPSVQVSRRPLCARLAAQPEYPRCLTPAVALNKHETPNGGIHFHSKHPRPPPKEPTHWPAFTPPRSANRRRSSGWLCHRPAHTQKCSSLIFQTDSQGVLASGWTADHRAIVSQNRQVAAFIKGYVRQPNLRPSDTSTVYVSAEHPIDAAISVIGTLIPVFTESPAKFGNDYDGRVKPRDRPDLVGDVSGPPPQLPDMSSKISGAHRGAQCYWKTEYWSKARNDSV